MPPDSLAGALHTLKSHTGTPLFKISVQPVREATSKASQGREPNTLSYTNPRRKIVPIKDARRVWGTLTSTTTSAITNVIKHLTPGTLAENLTVKRKYKTKQEGVSKK